MNLIIKCTFLAGVVLALSGCQSAYYSTMEKFGVEKRDLLVDRVEDARDAQEDTKEEFQDALQQFTTLVDYDGGELEKVYDKLQSQLKSSENAVANVRDRIGKIESVAAALFDEWDAEIEQYTSNDLRRKSQTARTKTESAYADMLKKMKAAEAKMDPVLALFRDQVLFLKHNLNARAIASLDTETRTIEKEVRRLIADMEASIAEADEFIASMR